MHSTDHDVYLKSLTEVGLELFHELQRELLGLIESMGYTWESLKESLLGLDLEEPIHPAAKVRYAKQRIHSLVTIRKPMMIRARTCC